MEQIFQGNPSKNKLFTNSTKVGNYSGDYMK